jgi:hypothetical protein
MTGELRVRTQWRPGTVTILPTPLSEALPVLPKLAYLALCRSIQALALLARSDATKDLEILCSVISSPCSAARSHAPSSRLPTAHCSRRSAGHCPAPAGLLLREAQDAPALAPPARATGRNRFDSLRWTRRRNDRQFEQSREAQCSYPI